MFLAPRQRKTRVFTRFWASASKNNGIYSVLWPGPSKNTGIYAVSSMLSEAFFGCQRHKHIVNYRIFTRGQYQKTMKNWPKIDKNTPNKDLQNASSNFTLFFPTPSPEKREHPSRLKDFRGGSAAGACPRVAKAMLIFHHKRRGIAGILELTLIVGSAGLLDLDVIAGWAWKLLNEDLLLQKYIPYAFLNKIKFMESWNCVFFLEQVGKACSRKLLRRFFPENCCQFQLSTSCKSASV